MSKGNEAELIKLMEMDNTYPNPDDPEFQSKIYKKREFYFHKVAERDEAREYKEVKENRDKICGRKFALYEHQALLANFINPQTPYKGLLVCHGTGTGKCLTKDTFVNINNRYVNIADFWDQHDNKSYLDEECGEWIDVEDIYHVNSVDKDGNNSIRTVNRCYRQYIDESIKVIKLENGTKIKCTFSHKFLTEHGWVNNLGDSKYIYIPKNPQYIGDKPSISVKFKEPNLFEVKCSTYKELLELQYDYSTRSIYTIINKKDLTLKSGPEPNVVNDCYACKIESIEYKDYKGYVYDLEVNDVHSFIANNIYVSNTCLAITIAEQFKELVYKYGTKIYILVSGPLIKESWKNSLILCTGETYLKQQDATIYVSEAEKQKQKKNAIFIALQYYRFMSYRSFYKKVLGEKIADKIQTKNNKQKTTYRKTKEGDFERELALDRIYNLNNSLIIVDEAHNLTENSYGEALTEIIKNSTNLKVLLLSATPMKNLASDIIELVNFIRPIDVPMERDKIFNSQKNHLMEIKPGGIEYFKQMTKGYVSFLRGADPLTFAERVEMGEVPDGLLFTKIIRCKMLPFQRKIYDEAASIVDEDALDRRSEAVANFAFPGLSDDKKSIKGYYGTSGAITIKNQIKSDGELLNKKIITEILNLDSSDIKEDMLQISDNQKSISGLIMKEEYLMNFSIKFYSAFKKIQRLFYQKKGARTAFVYSNLVKVGIELFQEILLQNGYLEYNEHYSSYKINNNTICYYCGKSYLSHKQEKLKQAIMSGGTSEYPNKGKDVKVPEHTFFPATFITITGKTSDDLVDVIPEEKQYTLDHVFSNIENKEGKYIKLVLGSKVMNEGINLKNVAEVHILDVYYNLGKVDQVIGRAIRGCSHYGMISDEIKYPQVKVYKYAVTLENGLSSEEELYQKAEKKYLLIKKLEKAIKEVSFDCSINRHGNIFPEEVTKYKNCIEPGMPNPNNEELCPGICGYTKCDFTCDEQALNDKYFDPVKRTYKKLSMNELDYSTFSHVLMRTEIENVKSKIKEMFRIKFDYTLEQILDYVQNSYEGEKKELFETFFVYKALDEMIPLTENDFNNFKDTVFNKFNQPGYLIYVNKYYIFQPFTQNENVPMYYRSNFDKKINQSLTLYNYIKTNSNLIKKTKKSKDLSIDKVKNAYSFDKGADYYYGREEYKYVGVVDKESSRKKVKQVDTLSDVFKIREARPKILDKKRGTDIPSIKGSVCATSKDKEYLENIAKHIGAKLSGSEIRSSICDAIKDRLLFLEKYSTAKKKNKVTYVIVPDDHPIYKFPYNLEDRLEYVQDNIKEKIKFKLDLEVETIQKKVSGEAVQTYILIIKHTDKLDEFKDFLIEQGAVKTGKNWLITID